jgi:hypothetical protein
VIASDDMATAATWLPVPSTPLEEVPGGWDGPAAEGTVFLSTEFDPGWELGGRDADPEVAFGWATSFRADGEPVRVRHEGGVAASIEVALLAILWLAALWVTRKPVAR